MGVGTKVTANTCENDSFKATAKTPLNISVLSRLNYHGRLATIRGIMGTVQMSSALTSAK